MKKIFKKIIASFVVVIQLLSLMSVATFADTNSKDMQTNNTEVIENVTTSGSISNKADWETNEKLELNLNTEKANINQSIKLDFDKIGIVDYYYEADGIMVIESNEEMSEIEFIANDEYGSLDVYADYGNGEFVKSSVYTYKYNDTVYISELGKDVALQTCMEEQYNSGNITKGEWEDAYYELCQSFVKELPSQNVEITQNNTVMVAPNSIEIHGKLSWAHSEFYLLPLRHTEIELRKKLLVGSTKLASGYTDNNGQFSLTVENVTDELDLFVRVNAISESLNIRPSLINGVYYVDFSTRENVFPGSSIEYDFYVDYDESLIAEKAISVLQGMIVGQKYASQMGVSTNKIIQVIYPNKYFNQHKDAAYCYGITDEDLGYVISMGGALWSDLIAIGVTEVTEFQIYVSEIGEVLYNNFDTLIHEYGHFVEHIMGNYGSNLEEIFNNLPSHSMKNDNFVKKSEKGYAMELTWSESWANAFSQIAQDYYVNEYSGITGFADGIDSIGDINSENNISHYIMESPSIDSNSCEAQEYAVTALLWDLYDNSGTTESHDNISSTYQQWWNYTTKAGTYTLTDFVNVIDEYYPTIRGKIGEIMAAHQISPGNLTLINTSNVIYNKLPPRFVWNINGSISNPNNMFDVAFYDKYDNFICSTPTFTLTQNYDTQYAYIVPRDVWNEAIKDYGGTFTINAVVRSYHTEEPVSGPYPSKYYPITLTNNYSVTIPSSSRYTEYIIKLDEGGYCDYTITFARSGIQTIQTFGSIDTIIELYSNDGTLLKGRSDTDDKGYSLNALVKYEVEANVEYKIRVKFYNSTVHGKTKLAIIPGIRHLASGVNELTEFEDITNIYNYAGCTYHTYIDKGYVEAITYTPTSAGDYTFEIQSDFDTYIYVIDPTSSELLVVNLDYNDDSGEGSNPFLSKHLRSGITYLIIYSAYNPVYIEDTKNLTISIDRVTT
ncbi:MAG: hypothetical protein J6A95_06650 [Clostridia bacterium]|nr:hypothetical protein [Clostridia bacterium]